MATLTKIGNLYFDASGQPVTVTPGGMVTQRNPDQFAAQQSYSNPLGAFTINDQTPKPQGAPQAPQGIATQQLAQAATPGGITAPQFNQAVAQGQAAGQLPSVGTDPNINAAAQVLATHYASGGEVPWYVKREATGEDHSQGLLAANSPGRTDTLNKTVPAGSYVIPADVVSGLGEGNTMAGANVLDKMMTTGPYGTRLPDIRHGGLPHPSAPQFSKGGSVPVVLAGGEYLVNPHAVQKISRGDLKHGHDILDKFCLHVRKKTKETLGKLPHPKR